MALTNKKLFRDMDTVFLTTSSEYMYLSSSIVKKCAKRRQYIVLCHAGSGGKNRGKV
jgi:phosphopantetheine adenylyltransferase